jgi:hypothetical protein
MSAEKPKSYIRHKHEIDPNGIPQFGLVAEEVDTVRTSLRGQLRVNVRSRPIKPRVQPYRAFRFAAFSFLFAMQLTV